MEKRENNIIEFFGVKYFIGIIPITLKEVVEIGSSNMGNGGILINGDPEIDFYILRSEGRLKRTKKYDTIHYIILENTVVPKFFLERNSKYIRPRYKEIINDCNIQIFSSSGQIRLLSEAFTPKMKNKLGIGRITEIKKIIKQKITGQ